MTAPRRSSDKVAAYLGLIIGTLSLAVMVVAIVAWTNSKYAGHGKAAAAGHDTSAPAVHQTAAPAARDTAAHAAPAASSHADTLK